MKKIIKKIWIALAMAILFSYSCTELDEEVFSTVVQNNFYQTKNDIFSALLRPYQAITTTNTNLLNTVTLQENTADLMATTQKGAHWQDGGIFHRLRHHEWTPNEPPIYNAWSALYSAVGYTNNALNDLSKLDYTKFGLTADDQKQHVAELNVLRAYWQLIIFDLYGSVPISTNVYDVVGCSSKEENFDFIEKSILDNISSLPKAPVANYEGRFTQGAAAVVLMRLYFNAHQYIEQDMFVETKEIAQDIIDGVYGTYSLDSDWNSAWCAENNISNEIILGIPQTKNINWDNAYNMWGMIFGNSGPIFNISGFDYGFGASGWCLTPSRNSLGEIYPYQLGNPYESYSDKDLRKRQHVIDANEVNGYKGLFLVGPQYVYHTNIRITGVQEWDGLNGMVVNDQIARIGDDAGANRQAVLDATYTSGTSYIAYDKLLPSDNSTGELSGGIRLIKYPNYPDNDARKMEADHPEFRLAEVYYTLAECKMREGDLQGAVDLINAVRQRAFAPADRASEALTTAGFDKYVMLREWGCEFIGEYRRRTDLIRNDVFLSGEWWDKKPSTETFRAVFPIPLQAINTNPLLTKTPGYTY